jgi:hypothetical protein
MERVFPDSNVLYPISVADLTLRLGDIALHEVLWTEDLLAEVTRILIADKGLAPEAAVYFCDCIRTSFPDGEISRDTYEHLIASRIGPDPDDHVHSAAAVAGRATVLLNADSTGFPAKDVGDARVVEPDRYFTELLEAFPDEVLAVLHNMAAERREPQTVADTLAALAAAGLTGFARTASKQQR